MRALGNVSTGAGRVDRSRFIISPVPPCGEPRHLGSVGVLELAGIQRFVNRLHAHRLEAASTLGTAAALHWLGICETNAACAVVHVSRQVDQQSEYCVQERQAVPG